MAEAGDQPRSVGYFLQVAWLNLTFWPLFLTATIVFAVWASATFFALLPIDRRRAEWLIRRSISRYGQFITHCGWPLATVKYVDFAPHEQPPFVFIANHRSSSDPFLMSVLPVEAVQVLNIWPQRIPLVGFLSTMAGYLKVRQIPLEEFMTLGSRLLEQGVSIIAFPEGTRSGSRQMGQFHGVAFRLAQRTGAKICPLAISGNEAHAAAPVAAAASGPDRDRQAAVSVAQDYQDVNPYVLKNRVRRTIQDYLDQTGG